MRAGIESGAPCHNTGGLALWFIRGERYERPEGMPFRSVRERCKELELVTDGERSRAASATEGNGTTP